MNKHLSDKPMKRTVGRWAVNEVAVAGAPCGFMEQWVKSQLFPHLPKGRWLFVDEDHHPSSSASAGDGLRLSGDQFEWNTTIPPSPAEYVLAIVNGHHFSAAKHLLFAHIEKAASLLKRDAEIKHIVAVVLPEGTDAVPAHIQSLTAWNSQVPVFFENEAEAIARQLVSAEMPLPTLKGLVLTGGKSVRMGEDKAWLRYHADQPQYQFLLAAMEKAGIEPHLSVAHGAAHQYPTTHTVIEDTFIGCGPMSGILSAFRHDPNSAWCIVACDLPQADVAVFQALVAQRNAWCDATAFFNDEKQWPEPLCAIWEPQLYAKALEQLSLGKTCPRKLLQTHAMVNVLRGVDPAWVANANTPEERDRWMQR